MNIVGQYRSLVQGNSSHRFPAKILNSTCSKIIAVMKRILLIPVEFLKRCFSKRKIVANPKAAGSLIGHARALALPEAKGDHRPALASEAPPRVIPLLWPQPFHPTPPFRQEQLQAEAPIQAHSPPSLKPKELKDFLKLAQPLDHGAKTSLSTLCEEIEPLTLEELDGRLGDYHKRLLNALTVDNVKQRKDYVVAIRSFLKTHPDSTLFPRVCLKDQEAQTTPYEVPRILASVLSPVLSAAFQQMREGREGVYSSPHFNAGVGAKVAEFIKNGVIHLEHVAQAMELYETSDLLMIEGLQDACRKMLIRAVPSLNHEELESLWAMSALYEDAALKFACIQYGQHPISAEFQEKRTILQSLKGFLISTPYLDHQQRATALLKMFHSSLLDKCLEVGINSIKILYASPHMDMAKLRPFKCLDLDFEPGLDDNDIVEALYSLLNNNNNLTELKLRLPQLRASSAAQFAEALQNSSLKSFELRFCEMDAAAVAAFSKQLAQNQKLEKVTLHLNRMGAQGWQQLAEGLKRNQQIRQLVLPGNTINTALPALQDTLKGHLPRIEIAV